MKSKNKIILTGATVTTVALSTCMTGFANDIIDTHSNDDVEIKCNATQTDATEMDEDSLEEVMSSQFNLNQKDVYKEETVYAFCSPTGEVNNILVNEKLNNSDGEDELVDKTDLEGIVNLKGNEEFTQNGNSITWQADGNDICYQGTTDKSLPVNVKVTYYLDGQEMSPEEMVGKSGKVKIRFDYTNNETVNDEICGKDESISVPFVAVTGLMLGDNFTNIEVVNGRNIETDKTNVIIGYGLPGINDSLGFDETDLDMDIEIPEYFEVNADVTEFSMDMTLTMVMNMADISLSNGIDLETVDETITSMSEAGDSLSNGAAQLELGAEQIDDNMKILSAGISTISDGAISLSNGANEIYSGAQNINTSALCIREGVIALDTALNTAMTEEEKAAIASSAAEQVSSQFAEGTETYNYIYGQAVDSFTTSMTSENTVGAIYAALYSSLHDSLYSSAVGQYVASTGYSSDVIVAQFGGQIESEVCSNLYNLAEGIAGGIAQNGAGAMGTSVVNACKTAAVSAASSGAINGAQATKTQIAENIEAIGTNGYSLVSGANALAEGTNLFVGSMPPFITGMNSLVSGASKLDTGASQLSEGASTLADGATTLSEGMSQFNEEAIEKIVDTYNGDVKVLAERVNALSNAAVSYKSFANCNEDEMCSTRFVIRTSEIN